jgi:predicted DNA-binding protein (UPF0251 family)
MLCNECLKKPLCLKLCLKAEKYVNQDYVPLTEVIYKEKSIDQQFPIGNPFPDLSTRTSEENIIIMFFRGGIKQSDIAENINVSRQFVHKIVKKYRLIIRKNLKIQVDSIHNKNRGVSPTAGRS